MMLTRSRVRRLRFSINALPLDLFTMIIDQLDPNPSERCLLALVCKHWRDPFTAPLYRHLIITNREAVDSLAGSGGLKRYRVDKLTLGDGTPTDLFSAAKIDEILDACPNLREFRLEPKCVGMDILFLRHPSLHGLTSLSLRGPLRGSRQSLSRMRENQPYKVTMIKEGSADPLVSNLRSLELAEEYTDSLHQFGLVAPNLHTLILSRYSSDPRVTDSTRLISLCEFLRKSTSLLHFTTAATPSWEPDRAARALQAQLTAIPTKLKTLKLGFSPVSMCENLFKVLVEEISGDGTLSCVGSLTFSAVSLWKLETIKGWAELNDTMKDRGVRLITRVK